MLKHFFNFLCVVIVSFEIYHLTHRCHKREFLLKFAKARIRLMQWLYEAKKKYNLVVLNYMITSNYTLTC